MIDYGKDQFVSIEYSPQFDGAPLWGIGDGIVQKNAKELKEPLSIGIKRRITFRRKIWNERYLFFQTERLKGFIQGK